ncbi:hypothetical protein [Staphylococcus hominis]|uniref:hypothetical protein n=1 Tax=Staphylococcus hominis TaxID=1290 RepID=UPI001E34240F|nr:hypothetical protein [Staphylococcus hominis]
MDERQEIVNKNMLIRAFGFLFIQLVIYLIVLNFIEINSTNNQLVLLGILSLTHIYIWIDSFFSKILYFDTRTKKDINKKLHHFTTILMALNLLLFILIFFKLLSIQISFIFIFTLLAINILLISIYYIVLRFWIIWYK